MIHFRSLLRNLCRTPHGISSFIGNNTPLNYPVVAGDAGVRTFSYSSIRSASGSASNDSKWLMYNQVVFPPTDPGEPERPAEIYHERTKIRYCQDKMWSLTVMVRGMSVDEAKKQLTFKNRLGAQILKDIIEEAQIEAVNQHNVEFKSNLWLAECFVRKTSPVKGVRRHSKGRFGKVTYQYINVYVKLREGKPPQHYYPPPPTTKELVNEYIQGLRSRRIIGSL